jgi:hypothetical protein
MGKYANDVPLVLKGTNRPTVVSVLLRDLQVKDAPEREKQAAVKKWLKTHKPTPPLQRSLEHAGYGVAK